MFDPIEKICDAPEIWVFPAGDVGVEGMGNVDVEVVVAGARWSGTFFTLANLAELMERGKQSGECAHGTYICTSDMVVVESLSREVIIKTVRGLIEDRALRRVFDLLGAAEEWGPPDG